MAKKQEDIDPKSIVILGAVLAALIYLFVGYLSSRNAGTPHVFEDVAHPNTFYTVGLTNVRSCASTDCSILGQYPLNTEFKLEYTDSNLPDWIQISWDDNGITQIGYINKSTLAIRAVSARTTQAIAPNSIVNSVSAKTLSAIVDEWSPAVPLLLCNFKDQYGNITYSQWGSGTVASFNGSVQLVTNRHVVSDKSWSYTADDCTIYFPDSAIYSIKNDGTNFLIDSGGFDVAYLLSKSNNLKTSAILNVNRYVCSDEPKIGDEVVILGYPVNGSSQGITITRGIISGIESNYYVTDAKVEHGNSGGAAISLKDDCYLGIPTYVQGGSLESLARILKADAFLQ